MQCKCGGKTKVKDTRYVKDAVYRQRVCKECGRVFYTEEYEYGDVYGFREVQKEARVKNQLLKK